MVNKRVMKFKKGSKAAKDYMAKIRAAKGKKTTKKVGVALKAKYFIEYMYKGIEQTKTFEKIPKDAGIRNGTYYVTAPNKISYPLLHLDTNMPVKVNDKKYTLDQLIEPTLNKKVGRLKLTKKETRLGMQPKTNIGAYKKPKLFKPTKAQTKAAAKRLVKESIHKDTKSHNVNIRVISGSQKAKSLIGDVSNVKKIDLLNFTKIEMLGRLFSITQNWSRLSEKITLSKPRSLVWTRKTLRENFVYPKKYEQKLTLNLLLYLLGNENNLFSDQLNR